ncbi:DUF3800 domain-containing protein [Thermococcus indicus]|uniref:DUF3800 domain-containing protein n=1 Tax=Thermococcus indicus TaxID=2586643 RepID=A0A4Y5SI67_9EURY|nr:DUF3800 domain-containing protein [Thermococcus indicus]QDA30335.1 DUF3800 domain-containing protein [Thermococcus indicus]
MKLFIDESGDLGGMRSGKRYFIVAGVVCDESEARQHIKGTLRDLKSPELKFSRLSYENKRKALSLLSTIDFMAGYAVLSKNDRGLMEWLDKSKKNKLLTAGFMHWVLISGMGFSEAVIDRSHYSREITRLLSRRGITITSEDSMRSSCLQLADAVANVVYLRYQHRNTELFGMLNEKLTFEWFTGERGLRKGIGKFKSGG